MLKISFMRNVWTFVLHLNNLVHFEWFYRNIHNLEVWSSKNLDFVKQKLRKQHYLQLGNATNILNNLSKEELGALISRSKNNDIVIQKSGKGNSFITIEKETYMKRMENLLSYQRKFERISLKNDTFLNFVVNKEKRIDTIFKNLLDSNRTSKEVYKTSCH